MAYLRKGIETYRSNVIAARGLNTPHIMLDKLHPAIAGKLMDGSTSHSGSYGTLQNDGLSYYYTDIKGSRPIHDPRIGAHFGSQRYRISSTQILEQETAQNGTGLPDSGVVSVDGREWMRVATVTGTLSGSFGHNNNADGQRYQLGNGAAQVCFLEIVGYFNDANILGLTIASSNPITIQIDGASAVAKDPFTSAVADPLKGRYVNGNTCANLALGATLGLHTLRLIAQDTTSTATRSQIQIPKQKVLSIGKKRTVGGNPHYDPFNGFVNSTSLHSAFVDTATSLGLVSGTGPGVGASWAITASNHIRPYNGGRVVKWVDASGTIKTSVNMMPPNAQNYGKTASNEVTTPSATNTVTTPCFSDDAIDHSLSELAKTFHVREFGNGSANGGSDGATWDDASMISQANNTGNDIGYVMDDGLTSLSAKQVIGDSYAGVGLALNSQDASNWWISFIGTGFSFKKYQNNTLNTQHDLTVDGIMVFDDPNTAGILAQPYTAMEEFVVQNLPYGSHVIKRHRVAASGWNYVSEMSFHQPKMPPIPADACIIADYMLTADFVAAGATNSPNEISKGVRRVNCSRDWKFTATMSLGTSTDSYRLPRSFLGYETASSFNSSLPYFGTHAVFENHPHSNRMNNAVLAGSTQSLETNKHIHISESTMGQQDASIVGSQSGEYVSIPCIDVHTPIHTSSHYQTFETPFLRELLGGDRNVDQMNLVVTPDGKTWDEVTRNTSYLGNFRWRASITSAEVSNTANVIFDDHRGHYYNDKIHFGIKDFAWSYDRLICLVPGHYKLNMTDIFDSNATSQLNAVFINGHRVYRTENASNQKLTAGISLNMDLDRGDWILWMGSWANGNNDNSYPVTHHNIIKA